MRKRLVLLSILVLSCGCAQSTKIGRITLEPPDLGEMMTELAFSGIQSAVGDNAGPIFTGEKRGEYRDRKEVERLGSAGFEKKYGRSPDLHLTPHSTDW